MLVCLAQAHPRVSILPSLRTFTPSPAPSSQSSRHRLTITCSSRNKPSPRPATPTAREVETGGTAFIQDQFYKAVRFQDVEACIYLLQHRNFKKNLSLTSTQLRSLVSSAFHHHRLDQAVDLVLSLPRTDPRNFSVLMKECLHRRDVAALDIVLKAREAAGIPPDAYSTSAKITALGTARRPADALAALQQAWDRPGCRTVEVCNAAIGACAAAGDWAGAEAVLTQLKDADLLPDVVTYNVLIKAAGAAGHMTKVKQLFDEILEAGLKPTHQTYTGLFSAAAKSDCKDTVWLFKVFNDMNLAPNDYVLSSFFSAASAAPCSRTQLDTVFSALAEARARSPLNDTTYTALLKLVTRQGIADRAVDVWRAAQQDGVALTPHLFSALFAACAAGQSPALVDVALDAYAELRDWWEVQDKHRLASWMERDVLWAYNSLLNFVGAEGRLDEALAVFEGMKREGPLPDAITFNTIIAGAGRAQDSQTAVNLFREMSNSGVEPTERTFGALLHAFATVGDAAGASNVLRSLHTAGMKPNAVMYTSFIDALVTSGEAAGLEEAFQVNEEMKRLGLSPSAVTYGCLLNACDKLGDVERAFKVYQQACDEGVPPSDVMHDILINVCTRGGRLDEALDLVKAMARTHSPMQQHTLDSLVRALCGSNTWRALRMLGLMQAMGMAPSHKTYLALVASCARSSDGAEALALYGSMRAQGMEVDGAAGSALISCLCQSQELPQAVAIYEEMMLAAWKRAATPSSGHQNRYKGRELRRGGLPKRAHVPDAGALASLAQAFAARGQLKEAWRYYKQLRRAVGGVEEACLSHRRMFEALIEQNCRCGSVERALVVFDDWKAASATWFVKRKYIETSPTAGDKGGDPTTASGGQQVGSSAQLTLQPAPSATKKKHPKLSNVSLAFLEACCQTTPGMEWRVYDVCSVMRMQKERKVQESLARPQKASHHVLGSVQTA